MPVGLAASGGLTEAMSRTSEAGYSPEGPGQKVLTDLWFCAKIAAAPRVMLSGSNRLKLTVDQLSWSGPHVKQTLRVLNAEPLPDLSNHSSRNA